MQVYLAAVESMPWIPLVMGYPYLLTTYYRYRDTKVDSSARQIFRELQAKSRGMILDSGLYTFFNNPKTNPLTDAAALEDYAKGYVAFTQEMDYHGFTVEVDAQPMLGLEAVWRVRERILAPALGDRCQYVWHIDDGPAELKRLAEFATYIGLSQREMKHMARRNKRTLQAVIQTVVGKILEWNPACKVHLLGCGEHAFATLHQVFSMDSSRWLYTAGPAGAILYFNGEYIENANKHERRRLAWNIRDQIAQAKEFMPKNDPELVERMCICAEAFRRYQEYLDNHYDHQDRTATQEALSATA